MIPLHIVTALIGLVATLMLFSSPTIEPPVAPLTDPEPAIAIPEPAPAIPVELPKPEQEKRPSPAVPIPSIEVVAVATTTPAVATTTATSTSEIATSTAPAKKSKTAKSSRGTEVTEEAPVIPTSEQEPRYTLLPAGENASLKISSSAEADPRFVSVNISPLHVYVGETQTFSAKISSSEEVASVTAISELDHETLELDLLPSGSDTFSASWVVRDTHVKTYHTTFVAKTVSGKEESVTLAWSDPCAGVAQGTSSSLSGSCTVSSVSGLDGGSLTIPVGTTLTLNSGATWVWNPGASITVNGSIAVNGTAQIKKGYLFYSGSTNDSANTGTMVFGSSPTMSGYVRSGTWFHFNPLYDIVPGMVGISNTVTVGGIPSNSPVILTDSGSGETQALMRINGGSWVTSGTMNPGDTLAIKFRTGSDPWWTYWMQASVGGSSSVFEVTTGEEFCKFNC